MMMMSARSARLGCWSARHSQHEPFDERSARELHVFTDESRTRQFLVGARGTPTPQVCLARDVPGTPGKNPKNEQPGPEDRHRQTNRGPKARTEAPKGCHTDERKGKHGAARPPHKQNTSTHKHQHAHPHTHTETKRTRPGTVKGREPKKKQ